MDFDYTFYILKICTPLVNIKIAVPVTVYGLEHEPSIFVNNFCLRGRSTLFLKGQCHENFVLTETVGF